jgi:hypothetical protein
MIDNSELKQVTFLTTRTSTGSKVDVFHQSQPLTQSMGVPGGGRRGWQPPPPPSLLGKQSQSDNIRFTVGQYWLIIKINGTNSVKFCGKFCQFCGKYAI